MDACHPVPYRDTITIPVSFADHRLDGEHHSRQKSAGIVVKAVIDVWRTVEEVPDAVAEKQRDSGALRSPGRFVDNVSDLPDVLARSANTDGALHAVFSDLDQSLGVLVNLPHAHGVRAVAVEPVEEHRHVNVQDISGCQSSAVGDAVCGYVVHAGADRLGKAVEVPAAGIGAVDEDLLSGPQVQLLGGDSWPDLRFDLFQNLPSKLTCSLYPHHLYWIPDDSSFRNETQVHFTSESIGRKGDAFGYLFYRERIQKLWSWFDQLKVGLGWLRPRPERESTF